MGISDSNMPKREHGMDDGNRYPLLDIPWRMFDGNGSWTKEYRQELIQYISSTVPRDGVSNFKFLLLGITNSGKSSFVNAVASIDAGEITQVVNFGGGLEMKGSLTRRHTFYKADQTFKNFILCDTIGFAYLCYEDFNNSINCLKVSDIEPLLDGHIKPNSKNWEMSRQKKEEPSISEKIHCVALVIDSHAIDLFREREVKYLGELTNQIQQYGCPLVVILTKIDILCGEVRGNISMTFSSRKVKQCVAEASNIFGIPEMNIYPVQNYTKQMGLDCNMDILILMAIKHMIKLANGYIRILRNNTEYVKQKNSSEDAETRKMSKDAEQTNISEDAEHRNSNKNAKLKKSSEDAEHSNSSKNAEQKNSSEDVEHSNSSKNAEQKNSSEDAEQKNSSKYAELKNSSEDAEHRNSSKVAELKNSSEDAEHRNSSKDAELKNSSEDAEHRNSSKDSEHKNSSEDAEHRNSSKDSEHKNSS